MSFGTPKHAKVGLGDAVCLSVEVRFAGEPAVHSAEVIDGLRSLFGSIDDEPRAVFAVSPGGRVGRERAFKWKTLEDLIAIADTGTCVLTGLRTGERAFSGSLYLRRNPKLSLTSQTPAVFAFALEVSRLELAAPLPKAARSYLERCAADVPLLHGAVTVLQNLAQASCEVTGGLRSEADSQPEPFRRRREHDWWRNQTETLWTRCRRLYAVNLLGPALATALGGADAAQAAGARNVKEIAGSLVFDAMEGPPLDSLDPAFLAATTRLRRWLWPHTFQNPLDAVGFEDEIGLADPPLGP
jgi:hypothetical protein